MLRSLIKKTDKIQKQMDNIGMNVETLRKNLKEILEIKIQQAIMEPTTGLLVDSTQLRKKINKLEDRSMNSKTGQTKIQGEKRLKKEQNIMQEL